MDTDRIYAIIERMETAKKKLTKQEWTSMDKGRKNTQNDVEVWAG